MEILTSHPREVGIGSTQYKFSELESAVDEKGLPLGDDIYDFVASDETPDRYGDIIRADKWKLTNYRKNPIVLFGHSSRDPIGKALKVWVEDKKLLVRIKFADEGTSHWIDTVRKLAKQKILKAVSVGFMPTAEPVVMKDDEGKWTGFEFVGQELLENSLVSVPANPNALSLRSMGIQEEMIRRLTAPDALVEIKHRARALELLRLGAASRNVFVR